MDEAFDGPCGTCSIDQQCCQRLTWLRLTAREYEEHFARHRGLFNASGRAPVYVISAKPSGSCPHFIDSRCAIYDDRPFECRLYPYSFGMIRRTERTVTISFHSVTRCPHKKALFRLISKDDARDIVRGFAREAFGDGYALKIRFMSTASVRLSLIVQRLMQRRGAGRKAKRTLFPR